MSKQKPKTLQPTSPSLFKIEAIPMSFPRNTLLSRCLETVLACNVGESFFVGTRDLDGARPSTLVNSTRYRLAKDKRAKGVYIRSTMVKGDGKNATIIGVRIYRVA
jgi:hypothetical protein